MLGGQQGKVHAMSVTLTTPWERAVNRWEYTHVDPYDPKVLDLATAKAVCAHVWQLCRMPGKPPSVTLLRPDEPGYIRGAHACVNYGTGAMRLMRLVNTRVLLHEIAHQITDDPLDELELKPLVEREMHGRIWLGNYVWLMDRLMGPAFNTFRLRATMPPEFGAATLPYHPVIWGQPRVGL